MLFTKCAIIDEFGELKQNARGEVGMLGKPVRPKLT